MNELKANYINKITLKNYKSIQDLRITLHSGLNLIIGQNGSGKTNFVQAIHRIFSESEHHHLPVDFEFGFEFTQALNDDVSKQKWTGQVKETTVKDRKIKLYESKLASGKRKISKDRLFHPAIMQELPSLEHTMIGFSLPNELPFLKKMDFLEYDTIEIPDGEEAFFYLWCNGEKKWGYFNDFSLKLESHERDNWYEDEDIMLKIKTYFNVNNQLKTQLKRFSPIKNCRIAKGYTIENQANAITINHVILEFFVNNNWYTWDELSDGTKRLFYIISQVLVNQFFVMLEEPELGLHPDQLFGIMTFLKAQSESKQIILTTHSPDVLNVLQENELHKVIVTQFDAEKGTLMHHLSPKKIERAHYYIHTEGLQLKDFWLHSNLEENDAKK